MKYYIGIDSGGTKTAFVLANDQGHIIDTRIDGTTNYIQIGINKMSLVLKRNIRSLMKNNHIKQADTYIYIGLASFGEIKSDIPKIRKALKEAFLGIKHTIGNDNNSAWAGSLKGQSGINVIAGTGSIAFGVDDYQNEQRCGGWGYFYNGDEGSGHWIGSLLINEFEKQADGRHKRSLIYKYTKEELGIKEDDFDILHILVNKWKLDRTKVASLSRIVFKAAKKKDPAALLIVDEAARELSSLVNALATNLSFKDKIKVSYSGGIFKNGQVILKPLSKYIDKRCTLVKPALSPVLGSVILAMKEDGLTVTNSIIKNLKSNH